MVFILLGIARAGDCADLPETYQECLDQGRKFFNQGNYTAAIKAYQSGLQLNPNSKECILNSAMIFKYAGNYAQAIQEYVKLLKIQPDKIIHFNLGEIYYLNSQPEKALAEFSQALKLGQPGALIWFFRAKCYLDLGNIDAAIQYFEEAVRQDENFAMARFSLGQAYKLKKNWELAKQEFEKAKELDPSLIDVYWELATLYYAQRDFQTALDYFRKVKAVDPENKQVAAYIDDIFKLAGPGFKTNLEAKETERLSGKSALKVLPLIIKDAPLVRVHVADAQRMRFKCSGDFAIKGPQEETLLEGRSEALYTLETLSANMVLSSEGKTLKKFVNKFFIYPADKAATMLFFDIKFGEGNFWAASVDSSYRGGFEISRISGESMRLINILNMEEYLYGVLPSEMPNSWPEESLKAQAVAARSESYAKINRHAKEGFNFCAQVHCQAYSGAKVEHVRTNSACDQTRGIIAVYQGLPVDAIYSNSCGGHTQNNIFGDQKTIPYLKGKPDLVEAIGFSFPLSALEMEDWLWGGQIRAFCNNDKFSRASNFRWMRIYKQSELEKLIKKSRDIGTLKTIEILERGNSSHIKKIRIVGTKEEWVVEKELNIRKALGNLRSSMFNVSVKKNRNSQAEEFIFYGGGWGHAVGLCQVGAATMAEQGYNYEQILKFYYTGSELKKMY